MPIVLQVGAIGSTKLWYTNTYMEVTVNSVSAMSQFGARLGALLSGGEVIVLVGDVGAGKTTLTKGIAAGMGIAEDVQSPTFTISRVYDVRGGLRLVHYDFYRLADAGIMSAELAESVADAHTVTVVEWAEIVRGVVPRDTLTITIVSPTEESRMVTLSAGGERSQAIVEGLK